MTGTGTIPIRDAVRVAEAAGREDLVTTLTACTEIATMHVSYAHRPSPSLPYYKHVVEVTRWDLPIGRVTWGGVRSLWLAVMTPPSVAGPHARQDMTLTEYDLSEPATLAVVLQIVGPQAVDPVRFADDWQMPGPHRVLDDHGATDLASKLTSGLCRWAEYIGYLRGVDPRPLPVPVAGRGARP